MKYSQNISDYIESHKDEMINTLAELVKIPSVKGEAENNKPFGKYPASALEKALDICNSFGFKTKNIDNYAGHADLSDMETELAVLCHLDVVPAGNDWTYNPFELYNDSENGLLFGRGTIDNKAPAVAVMYAMKAIKDLNIPLKKNVRFVMGTDEENGSSDMKYYLSKEKMPSKVFTPDGSYPLINIEKGMIRLSFSKKFNSDNQNSKKIISINGGKTINAVSGLAYAELFGFSDDEIKKAVSDTDMSVKFDIKHENEIIKITAYGTDAHASTPEKGDNAITAIINLISALCTDNSEMSGYNIKILSSLYPYGETDGASCGIKCSDEKSGSLTSVLSVLKFDENGFEFKNDIRFPVSENCDSIINKIRNLFSKYEIDMEILLKDEPHYTDENSSFIKSLLKVYEDITGFKGECIAIGGGTYVHNINGGVAFGAEFPDEDNNMHGADEHIKTESFLLNAKIIANAIIEICGE